MEAGDTEILIGLKAGDRGSFDRIFREYYRYLFSIAFTYIKDEHIARDIVQDVFMDLWVRREKIEIEYALKYFLRRAVINSSLAQLRKLGRIQYDPDQITEHRLIDETDTLVFAELTNIVRDTVAQLPERCQEVYRLSRDEGLTHKEIGLKLDISAKTIENHITKALKLIRSELKRFALICVTVIIWTLI